MFYNRFLVFNESKENKFMIRIFFISIVLWSSIFFRVCKKISERLVVKISISGLFIWVVLKVIFFIWEKNMLNGEFIYLWY